jgi:hypothetical protein
LLQLYATSEDVDWGLTKLEWTSLAEFEAIFDITRITIKMMQYEELFVGAFGVLIKAMALKQLRHDTLKVVDLQKVTTDKVCAISRMA